MCVSRSFHSLRQKFIKDIDFLSHLCSAHNPQHTLRGFWLSNNSGTHEAKAIDAWEGGFRLAVREEGVSRADPGPCVAAEGRAAAAPTWEQHQFAALIETLPQTVLTGTRWSTESYLQRVTHTHTCTWMHVRTPADAQKHTLRHAITCIHRRVHTCSYTRLWQKGKRVIYVVHTFL